MAHSWGHLLMVLIGLLIGSSPTVAQLPQIRSRSSKEAAANVAPSTREEWFRISFDGKPVGFESLTTTAVFADRGSANDEPGLVRRVRDTHLKLRRFGNDLSVSAHLETVETSDGILRSWSLRRTAADGVFMQRTGSWNRDNTGFDLTERVGSTVHREMLPATVQPRSPILPGWIPAASTATQRHWTSAVLFPETSAVVDVEIEAADAQGLQLSDGRTITVTRFDYWPTDNQEMKSSVFYDDQLAVVRVEQPLMGRTLQLERVDAAEALGQDSLEALDLQFSSAVPVKRALPIDSGSSTTLTLSVFAGETEQIGLPSSEFQSVEQSAANQLIVTLTRPVYLQTPESTPAPSSRRLRIDPVYTSASRWITSEDDSIKRMGIIAAGSTSIPLEKCRRLTRHVWKQIRFSPFSTSLQPATSVAKNLRGDCTEHAVLLSALMRSQGIPARVAVGFVYVPNPASFAPHMWTEAFIDGKWLPFDSTRGPDGIGLTHLKVTDSTLGDEVGSGTVLFVPLLNFLGRATVDVGRL